MTLTKSQSQFSKLALKPINKNVASGALISFTMLAAAVRDHRTLWASVQLVPG